MNSKLEYEKKIMEELRDVPDEEMPKIIEIIHHLKEGILQKSKKGSDEVKEPLLDIEDIAVETGISDLAQHHDFYLYGVPKGD